ncbi:DNA helicase [Tanacetum coccineum]
MAETSETVLKAAEKGKLTLFQPEIINLQDIRPIHTKKTIELRVYQKWIAKNVTTKEPSHCCCILLDKQGNATQANMDLKDTEYFNELLQLNNAYRISRADVKGVTLTDYIGCIHRISDPIITNDATRSRVTRRIIDIQNLDSLNLPFVIWNDMAKKFDMDKYAEMPKPVVIVVSSTLSLTSTPVTHYSLNPNIPKVHHILSIYVEFINPTAALDIQRQPCHTDEEEKMRNRYSIQSLLNVNPQHYKRVKFTTEATVIEINPSKGWYYRKCNACNKRVPEGSFDPQCSDHGPQPMPNYRYCFRAIIDDGTGMARVTCFSLEAHTFVPDCNDVGARPDDSDFNLDIAFKPSPQPLLSLLPPHSATPPSLEIQQQTTSATTPTASESEPRPSIKDSSEGSQTSSQATKKTAKRELLKDTHVAQNKPRQET